jgi:hypothetical protein
MKFGPHIACRLDTIHESSQHLKELYTTASVSELHLLDVIHEKRLTQARSGAKARERLRKDAMTATDSFIVLRPEGGQRS